MTAGVDQCLAHRSLAALDLREMRNPKVAESGKLGGTAPTWPNRTSVRLRALGDLPPFQLDIPATTPASGRRRSFQQPSGPAVAPTLCETSVEMDRVVLELPVEMHQLQLLIDRRKRIRFLVELAVDMPHELRPKHSLTHTRPHRGRCKVKYVFLGTSRIGLLASRTPTST